MVRRWIAEREHCKSSVDGFIHLISDIKWMEALRMLLNCHLEASSGLV